MPTAIIPIPQLTSATDGAHLEKALEAVPGVSGVHLDIAAHTAEVEHRDADLRELVRAVHALGYETGDPCRNG
ncbi:MAG TPA: heavy metal-associated domain-containing protein [Acidobacteriota bacterium]|nr:heavy metal-associated domain-containing protein [Acidobacteriota bacterium]